MYIFLLDKNFVLFFVVDIWWEKKIKIILYWGFLDDDENILEVNWFIKE